MISELISTTKLLDVEKQKGKTFQKQFDELNARYMKISIDLTDSQHENSKLKDILKQCELKEALIDESRKKIEEIMQKCNEQEDDFRALNNSCREELNDYKDQNKILFDKNIELNNKLSDNDSIIKDLNTQVNELKNNSLIFKTTIEQLKANVIEQSKMVDTNIGDEMSDISDISTLKKMNQEMKKILRCNLCKQRYKNTIIYDCNHLFCDECIGKMMDSRERKCPTCRKKITRDNIKKIWWG